MFDPKSSQELADVLVWLMDHPAERETLISKGRERAKNFSWDKTAAETVKIYRSLKDDFETMAEDFRSNRHP